LEQSPGSGIIAMSLRSSGNRTVMAHHVDPAHPHLENVCLRLSYVVGAFIAGLAISTLALWHGIMQ